MDGSQKDRYELKCTGSKIVTVVIHLSYKTLQSVLTGNNHTYVLRTRYISRDKPIIQNDIYPNIDLFNTSLRAHPPNTLVLLSTSHPPSPICSIQVECLASTWLASRQRVAPSDRGGLTWIIDPLIPALRYPAVGHAARCRSERGWTKVADDG